MFIGLLVALSIVIPIGLTLLVAIVIRWMNQRDDRRLPFRGKLHQVAGFQLIERIREHDDEMLSTYILLVLIGPLLLSAWALRFVPWKQVHFGIGEAILVVAALAVVFWSIRRLIRLANQRRHARDGLAAEQMTAQQLNRLIGEGCQVLHDVPADGFNLDHVVVGPRGVFMVETKSIRKHSRSDDDSHYKVSYDGTTLRFKSWSTNKPIKQARTQAQWLARYLQTAVGKSIPVVPAVALPGWWIDRDKAGAQAEVKVFTPMGRGVHFMLSNDVGSPVDENLRALVAQALVMRYPEVE